MSQANGNGSGAGRATAESFEIKVGLAEMLKGGVIMDVVTPEHAKIAEDAGAVAVMALERVPSDIRAAGGVARMSDPAMIAEIIDSVTIPVMAKARIGHFVEAQILEAMGVDYIDESEVLTPADENNHINKHDFKVPFVCGCRDLGEALRRIGEGAAMIRTKGEAGTGNIVEGVRHLRTLRTSIRRLAALCHEELRNVLDLPARIGGEEFAVLLPETDLPNALLVAERLRQRIATMPVQHEELEFQITCSFGVSTWNAGEPDIAEAMERADAALYRAKDEGRNRVVPA